MRISKIKKFAPSPNTLFIGTDANTGDTYNFLGSYVSGNARGDFYNTTLLGFSATPAIYTIPFNGTNSNFISGFEIEETFSGEKTGIKALKTGIFQIILTVNTRSTTVGSLGVWIVKGVNADVYSDVTATGQRTHSIANSNIINTQIFKWMLKLTEGDVIQFRARFNGTQNMNFVPISSDTFNPGSYSVQVIINEVQI